MKTYILGVSALALMWSAGSVRAQEAPPQTTEEASTIDDIVVTATRRETSLQRTAIALTAVTGEELSNRGVTTVTEISRIVPAVKIGQVAGSGIQITVRGVGNFGGDSFAEPGVAVNLDGVYLARTPAAAGVFFDVDRVEVLKGPQGTLYGRNSTGGVVNVITNDPGQDLGGAISAEVGNFDLRRLSAAVNIPLSDTLALRLAGQTVQRDGYLSDGYGDEDTLGLRGKLSWKPTDRLSILVQADYAKTGGMGSTGVWAPFIDGGNPYLGPSDPRAQVVFTGAPLPPAVIAALPRITDQGFLDNESAGVQATINYDVGYADTTLILAHREVSVNYLHFSAGFPVTDDTRDDPSKTDTAELRVSSKPGGDLNWVAGLFYFKDDLHTRISPDQGTTFSQPDVHVNTESISTFGELTYSLTDRLRLTAGGRWTSDDKVISGSQTSAVLAPPAAYPIVCPASAGAVLIPGPTRNPSNTATFGATCRAPVAGQATFEKFTWKLGVEADIGEASLLYATVATGFKAGGFYASLNTAPEGSFPNNGYEPETLTAYTIGSKNRFLGNTLQINAETFYWDYQDKQVPHIGIVQPGNNISLIVENAASASVYGAELESVWQPTEQDQFTFGVQYLKATYDEFLYNVVVPAFAQDPNARPPTTCPFTPIVSLSGPGTPGVTTVNCSDRVIPFSPEWVFNLGYRHTFDLSGGATVVAALYTRIESEFQVGEEYLPGQTQDQSTVSDADLTWTSPSGAYALTAYVKNIEDEAVAATGFVQTTIGRPLVDLRPPRTYGLRLNYQF